jgi:hypothetical protein
MTHGEADGLQTIIVCRLTMCEPACFWWQHIRVLSTTIVTGIKLIFLKPSTFHISGQANVKDLLVLPAIVKHLRHVISWFVSSSLSILSFPPFSSVRDRTVDKKIEWIHITFAACIAKVDSHRGTK